MAGPKIDLRERTKDFALRVVRMFSALPKRAEAQVLGKQVLRSGTSVGANYHEAFRARSRPEFVSKCGDCLREIEERSVPGGRDVDGQAREVAGELRVLSESNELLARAARGIGRR